MYYIGIDNGLHGAVAVITENKEIVFVKDYTKDLYELNNIINSFCGIAVIEKPIMYYGGGIAGLSTFNTFGHWEAILQINAVPYSTANPAIKHGNCWRKEFGFKSAKSADLKNESIKICLDLFHDAEKWIKKEKPINGKGGRKQVLTDIYNDNRAESLLLAELCRSMNI